MKSFGEARNDFLNWCRSKIGTVEIPAGSNKTEFGKRYGWDGVFWCNIFTSDGCEQTGNSGAVPKTAAVAVTRQWGQSVGRFFTTPQAGDHAIFSKDSHIEVVESWDGKNLIQIGGNTSNGAGSTSNGGGVYRNNRTRAWKAGKIVGFVRPFYGFSRDEIKRIQTAIGVKADGAFGPASKAALKAFQSARGLVADGIPGPATWTAVTGEKFVETAMQSLPTIPAQNQNGRKIATDGKMDRGGLHAKTIQERLNQSGAGLKVDGIIGDKTVRALQTYLETKVDGVISGQTTAGRDRARAFVDSVFKLGGGGSTAVKAYQAYCGIKADGIIGPDTINTSALMINGYPAFLTPADKGVMRKRKASAGL